jgi:putative hydrolase of the HAD superfamily
VGPVFAAALVDDQALAWRMAAEEFIQDHRCLPFAVKAFTLWRAELNAAVHQIADSSSIALCQITAQGFDIAVPRGQSEYRIDARKEPQFNQLKHLRFALLCQFCAKYRPVQAPLRHIRWILFDLDDTLWDFEGNAEEALQELFERHGLPERTGKSAAEFIAHYQRINKEYWRMYESGLVDKHLLRTGRFTDAFRAVGLPESEHPENAWEEYLEICPLKTRLMPGAKELLETLHPHYNMAVVTNGFEITQRTKLATSGLSDYFDAVVSSEAIGHPKPSPIIFHHAMELLGAKPEATLMVGDNADTDIQGARAAGLETAWYCRQQPIDSAGPEGTYLIFNLSELPALLR